MAVARMVRSDWLEKKGLIGLENFHEVPKALAVVEAKARSFKS